MKYALLLGLAILPPSVSLAAVSGEPVSFTSPNGLIEQCVRLRPLPGVTSNKKDGEEEARLCSYDIYRSEVAVCPKEHSTSPGTFLFSNEGTGLTQEQFEAQRCGKGAQEQNTKLTKFKNSMNQSGTSGTYSQSSLVYYQFARYFNTLVRVPVAVYRSFDKDTHYQRVSSRVPVMKGMIGAGWNTLRKAELNPASYRPARDLFTDGNRQIYGVLLGKDKGDRYGAEVNGIRSSWGDAQNNDFQNTPGFLALRSEQPFAQAVAEGIAGAKRSAKLAADLGSAPLSQVQIGIWMRELSEIVLLDYLFSQQDRVGNIDYEWYWVYLENGKVKTEKEKRDAYNKLPRRKLGAIQPPAEISGFQPVLVQKSSIGDNDAGVRTQYVNYAKRTKMLEKVRHLSAETYRQLLALSTDLQVKGPVYRHLQEALNLTDAETAQVVKNSAAAAQILVDTCRAGQLRFDLDLTGIVSGQVSEARVDCERP